VQYLLWSRVLLPFEVVWRSDFTHTVSCCLGVCAHSCCSVLRACSVDESQAYASQPHSLCLLHVAFHTARQGVLRAGLLCSVSTVFAPRLSASVWMGLGATLSAQLHCTPALLSIWAVLSGHPACASWGLYAAHSLLQHDWGNVGVSCTDPISPDPIKAAAAAVVVSVACEAVLRTQRTHAYMFGAGCARDWVGCTITCTPHCIG
jgi:hypothetical protein